MSSNSNYPFDDAPVPVTQNTPLSVLPTTIYQQYTTQMNFWQAQMTAYQTQITALLASPVESYTFSGGQGSQSAKRRSLESAQKGLEHAESRYLWYWKKLNGYGNVAMALRRR